MLGIAEGVQLRGKVAVHGIREGQAPVLGGYQRRLGRLAFLHRVDAAPDQVFGLARPVAGHRQGHIGIAAQADFPALGPHLHPQ